MTRRAVLGRAMHPGGRPPKAIDCALARRAAGIGCTTEEIAVAVGVTRMTLYNHLQRSPQLQRAIDEGRALACITLREAQWEAAEAGDATMLVWLGKQILGQRDRRGVAVSGKASGPAAAVTVTRGVSDAPSCAARVRTTRA